MKKVKEKLLNIVRSSYVNQIDMDYFKKHVKENPNLWGNYYLWSVESHNYQFSNYIIRCGFNLNNDSLIYRRMITCFEYSKWDLFLKIHNDGFVLTFNFINELCTYYNNDLDINNFINNLVLPDRKKKIDRIKNRIKEHSQNNNYIS